MSEMRDDLLATLGAVQEGADKSALADAFCDRWQKEARKEPRFKGPPWSGWFEFFGWTWVVLVLAGLLLWFVAGMTFKSNNTGLNVFTVCVFIAALLCCIKWIGIGEGSGRW